MTRVLSLSRRTSRVLRSTGAERAQEVRDVEGEDEVGLAHDVAARASARRADGGPGRSAAPAYSDGEVHERRREALGEAAERRRRLRGGGRGTRTTMTGKRASVEHDGPRPRCARGSACGGVAGSKRPTSGIGTGRASASSCRPASRHR